MSVALHGATITAVRLTDGFIAAAAAPDITCNVGSPTPGTDACRVSVKLARAFPALGSLTIETTSGTLVVALNVVGVWVPIQPVSREAPFTIFGGGFAPSTSITVLWDALALGSLTTNDDGTWSFTFGVPRNTSNNPHQVCVLASPANICTTVAVEAAVLAPSPSPSLAASPSPSPTGTPAVATSPGADTGPTGGVSLMATISRPPFVFFPIALVLGLLGLLAWFVMRAARGNDPEPLVLQELPPVRYEPAPEPGPLPPPASEPAPPAPTTVVHYETPGHAAPPAATPVRPPDDADLPPDLPEPSD